MENMYELMVLLKPLLPDDVRKAVHRSVVDLVEDLGGEIVDVDVWGKRYLAYEIEKHTEGYYIVYVIKLEPSNIKEMKRKFNLQPDFLRYLLIKVSGREEVGMRVKKKEMDLAN